MLLGPRFILSIHYLQKHFIIKVFLSFFFILFPNMIILRSLIACALHILDLIIIINQDHDPFLVLFCGMQLNIKVISALSILPIIVSTHVCFDEIFFPFLSFLPASTSTSPPTSYDLTYFTPIYLPLHLLFNLPFL